MERQLAMQTTLGSLQARPGHARDLRQVVPMLNRASHAIYGGPEFELARFHARWRAPDLDLEADTRVMLSRHGEPVGLAELWNMSDPPLRPTLFGRVDPRWEGQGIGTALLHWGCARALEAASGRGQVVLRSVVVDGHAPAVNLLTGFGMRPERTTLEMGRPLSGDLQHAAWPEGIEVRGFRFPQDARLVYHADFMAFKDHWGFDAKQDEHDYRRWRHHEFEQNPFDPSLWYLAMDDEDLAGVVLCRPRGPRDPSLGWIGTLAVLPAWRGRGLGTALVRHACCELRARGRRCVGLTVDGQNTDGAVRLYTKAGMTVVRSFTHYQMELRSGGGPQAT